MNSDPRAQSLLDWLQQQTQNQISKFHLITEDASFRRYFRFSLNDTSYIGVDAPPETENTKLFVELAAALDVAGLNSPKVLASDFKNGFMWQNDLGNQQLAEQLRYDNANELYQNALALLPQFQQTEQHICSQLPSYDEGMISAEVNLFKQWFLQSHLSLEIDREFELIWQNTIAFLTTIFVAQPSTLIHRDFHSRNLMMQDCQSLAIIDFQGAVYGPVTYDPVSLLKDCYLRWPDNFVKQAAEQYRKQYYPDINVEQWQMWFDLTGLQRHLKAVGIFARLHHRDNKSGYLADIPRTMSYIFDVCQQYPELTPLYYWLQQHLLTMFEGSHQ